MENQKTIDEIAALLKEKTGIDARHSPNTYDDTLTSKASSTWGWNEPLQYKKYLIVWHQFSPIHKGERTSLFFDFIPAKQTPKTLETLCN